MNVTMSRKVLSRQVGIRSESLGIPDLLGNLPGCEIRAYSNKRKNHLIYFEQFGPLFECNL